MARRTRMRRKTRRRAARKPAVLAFGRYHAAPAARVTPRSLRSGGERNGLGRRKPGALFAGAIAPVDAAHSGPPEALISSRRLITLLGRRTDELAAARTRIAALQAELAQSARQHAEMLERSRLMELRMRRISHRLLSVQEEERLRISRDLHDAIGQTLTGINVGLATLKNEAAAGPRGLAEAIRRAQRLVERSMKTVHQFAWELRPTLLDDLGLVPALRSYTKLFAARTGVKVRFSADAKFDRLDGERSVALFRVAQGALSNVERHARAGHARLALQSLPGAVRLEVGDDGRSFAVQRIETSRTNKHLGLLVMRERMEMVGGSFSITSSPKAGTTVRADIPYEAVADG